VGDKAGASFVAMFDSVSEMVIVGGAISLVYGFGDLPWLRGRGWWALRRLSSPCRVERVHVFTTEYRRRPFVLGGECEMATCAGGLTGGGWMGTWHGERA
jgi:hypothetical protein